MSEEKKTILSRNGYSISKKELTASELSEVRRELTVIPHVEKKEYAGSVKPIKIYDETEKRIYMPRHYGVPKFGAPKVNKLPDPVVDKERATTMKFNPSFPPFPHQQPIINKIHKHLKTNHGGVLSLYCGFGKTFCAIYISSLMKIKTAVVCHTTDLMHQWKAEIKKYMPKARIGLVQQKKCVVENKDIILISLKTLSKKEFPAGTFDGIGLAVWDEIHLMVTQLFSKAFPKLTTPYSLGLSATPHRKDKCETIFYNFIGPVAHYEKRPPNCNVRVDCLVYGHRELILDKDFRGKPKYTTTVTKMCYKEERILFIAKIIAKLAVQGRCILVLSEYVRHLKELKIATENEIVQMKEMMKEENDLSCGLFIGEMSNDQREESRKCDVIFGTYKIASVGMDIPTLNTLVLASPRKEIEQSVGRIFRKKGNFKPRIVDVIDDHNMFIAQGRVRKVFYKKYHYKIVQTKVNYNGKVTSQRILFDMAPKTKLKKTSSLPQTIQDILLESSESGS